MASSNNRTKYGYYNYADIQAKIDDGTLDEWDVVWGKDTHEQYLILGDKTILPIKSKSYTYESVDEAVIAINQQTDTYVGQVVSIVDNGRIKGYIVDEKDGAYTVTPLGELDYKDIENKPTINGKELDEELVLDAEDVGAVDVKDKITDAEIEDLFKAIFG